jgi:hypothetical protein
MSKARHLLASPNAWVAISSVLALLGGVLSWVGFLTGRNQLVRLGIWLMFPLLLGGIFLITVICPILMAANRKNRRN